MLTSLMEDIQDHETPESEQALAKWSEERDEIRWVYDTLEGNIEKRGRKLIQIFYTQSQDEKCLQFSIWIGI